MAFVGTGVRVEYDHAMIVISVGYIDFVGVGVDFCIGRTAKTADVGAVGLRSQLPDLQDKFAVARELQILSVIVSITADPDEAAWINADAVLILRPVVALAGAAPGLNQI